MKLRLLLLALLAFTAAQAQRTYKAMFLGNSYTYVNDLPSILQSLTLAGGDTLIKDSNTPGGYTFQGHSTNTTSLSLIQANDWDFAILQEQSQIPSFPQSQVQQDCYPYAAILNDNIKAHDSCTVTVFYMTWGRKYGDASNCGGWPAVCTYAGMQYELRRSYLNLASQNNALVAPCGSAWWESIKRDSTLELYQGDFSHPAYTGSYLNACVFYATMYRRSPVGLNFYGSLTAATAQYLQQVAHDVVFDSLTQWRIGLDDVQADFAAAPATQGLIQFSNSSVNATSYLWNFGDGGSDVAPNPSHTYTQSGFYPVTLIATNGCTSDTLTDTVQIVIVGRAEPLAQQLRIAPNPSAGIFTVSGQLDATTDLQVYDLQGRALHHVQVQPEAGMLRSTLDLRHLPRGVYVLRVGTARAQRIVIE
jgi:PKD domain/Secretion system C-terminal sorting domain